MLVQPSANVSHTKMTIKLPLELASKVSRYANALSEKSGRGVTTDETIALLLDYAINKDADFKRLERQKAKAAALQSSASQTQRAE